VLKQGACQLKQRKIDTRQRLGFNGLDMQCCSEAMSGVVKTVKDHEAIKTMPQWTADMFKAQTQPALLIDLNFESSFFICKKFGPLRIGSFGYVMVEQVPKCKNLFHSSDFIGMTNKHALQEITNNARSQQTG
jgi:hypothetical protein